MDGQLHTLQQLGSEDPRWPWSVVCTVSTSAEELHILQWLRNQDLACGLLQRVKQQLKRATCIAVAEVLNTHVHGCAKCDSKRGVAYTGMLLQFLSDSCTHIHMQTLHRAWRCCSA